MKKLFVGMFAFILLFVTHNSSVYAGGPMPIQWTDQEVCNTFFNLIYTIKDVAKGDEQLMASASIVHPPKAVTSIRINFKDGAYGLGTVCKFTFKDLTTESLFEVYFFVWRDSLRPTYSEVGSFSVFPIIKSKGGAL